MFNSRQASIAPHVIANQIFFHGNSEKLAYLTEHVNEVAGEDETDDDDEISNGDLSGESSSGEHCIQESFLGMF